MIDGLDVVRLSCLTMKTATVRDLRNHFARISRWVEAGEEVEVTKRGRAFARIEPVQPQKRQRFKMPDVMARLNEAFGDTCYSAEVVQRMMTDSRGDRS